MQQISCLVLETALGIAILIGCSKHKTSSKESQARPIVSSPLSRDSVILNTRPTDKNQHLSSEIARFDPKVDGWNTEVFHDRAKDQLKNLSAIFNESGARWKDAFSNRFGDTLACSSVDRKSLQSVYDDGIFRVSRYVKSRETRMCAMSDFFGMLLGGPATKNIRADFKIVQIETTQGPVECTVIAQLVFQTQNAWIQQNALWKCNWISDGQNNGPKLQAIQIQELEEVSTATRLFVDATQSVLGDVDFFSRQFKTGIDAWRSMIDWRFGIEIIAAHGLAVGDINGDGLDDLFVCEPGGLPNRLFLQTQDGTVIDASSKWQVDYMEPTNSALILDLDNDGDQDLVLASSSYVLFLENRQETFELRYIHESNSVARSMCSADYDQDGDLDIYVCGYFSRRESSTGAALGRPIPYHDANNGVPNLLLENGGKFRFRDVAAQVGLQQNNQRFSYAAAWLDYDNDGDQDLYVANDFGRNNLYRNEKGRFQDVAGVAGVEDISAGMSVSCADFDGDGNLDIYVGNMFSSAGNRIAFQRNFNPKLDESNRASFQRHARGNSLFRNLGSDRFQDVSLTAHANMGRWSWSSNFVDMNNDGWQDLAIGNGMVTNTANSDDL